MTEHKINPRKFFTGVLVLVLVCFGSLASAMWLTTNEQYRAFALVLACEAFFGFITWGYVCDENYKFSTSDRIFLSIMFAPLAVAGILLFGVSTAVFHGVVAACLVLPTAGFIYAKFSSSER